MIRIQHLITLLVIAFMLLVGCGNTTEQPPIPYRKTDIPSADRDKPPRGETDETGYWWPHNLWTGAGHQQIDWWIRTEPFTEYDKLGIPTKYPVDENGRSYINTDHFPEHLKERLADVRRKHNRKYTPAYYQDIYDTFFGQLSSEDAVKFCEAYNFYNPVVLKHMEDYQAFKYIQRTTGMGGSKIENLMKEFAGRVFDKQPHTEKGLETGLLLGRIREVLKHHPNNAEALFRWGLRLSNEQPEEAIKYLLRADKYENKPRRHLVLARIYQKLNDRENALYHFKECYRLDPLNFQYGYYLSDLLTLELGRKSDAGSGAAYRAYEHDKDLIARTAFPESYKAAGGDPQKDYDFILNSAITYMCEAITLSPKEPLYKDKLQVLLEKRDLNVTDGLHLTFLILDDK